MRFLLDTNAVIAAINNPRGQVARRMRRYAPGDVGVSSIVTHELWFGAYKSQRNEHNLAVVDGLRFTVLPFDADDARHAGELRAALARQGQPIGAYDVLIAGQARARGLTLVSHNLREFARVAGLTTVDWGA